MFSNFTLALILVVTVLTSSSVKASTLEECIIHLSAFEKKYAQELRDWDYSANDISNDEAYSYASNLMTGFIVALSKQENWNITNAEQIYRSADNSERLNALNNQVRQLEKISSERLYDVARRIECKSEITNFIQNSFATEASFKQYWRNFNNNKTR